MTYRYRRSFLDRMLDRPVPLFIIVAAIWIGTGLGIVLTMDYFACSSRWGDRASWGPITGCMVDGIPADNIRINLEN